MEKEGVIWDQDSSTNSVILKLEFWNAEGHLNGVQGKLMPSQYVSMKNYTNEISSYTNSHFFCL